MFVEFYYPKLWKKNLLLLLQSCIADGCLWLIKLSKNVFYSNLAD